MQNGPREKTPHSLRLEPAALQHLRSEHVSFTWMPNLPCKCVYFYVIRRDLNLGVFTGLFLNPCKAGLGGKLHVLLTHVRFATDTGSSPLHSPALPEPFPAHINSSSFQHHLPTPSTFLSCAQTDGLISHSRPNYEMCGMLLLHENRESLSWAELKGLFLLLFGQVRFRVNC